MSVLIIASAVIYFVAFVYFGDKYSSKQRELEKINKDKSKDQKKVKDEIKIIKKNAVITNGIIFILDLIILVVSTKTKPIDFLYITILACVFYLCLLIIFFLKGHGTIDSNKRMNGGLRI